jgi:hypothetical protein
MKLEKIVVTAEELAQFESFLERAGPQPAKSDFSVRLHREMVEYWKVNHVLYKRYGGTVICQAANPHIPTEAWWRFFEDAERGGAFEVYDKKDRDALYHFMKREQRYIVPPDEVDFETPYWLWKQPLKPKKKGHGPAE